MKKDASEHQDNICRRTDNTFEYGKSTEALIFVEELVEYYKQMSQENREQYKKDAENKTRNTNEQYKIRKTLKDSLNNRVPRTGGIKTELWKYGEEKFTKIICQYKWKKEDHKKCCTYRKLSNKNNRNEYEYIK